MLLSAAVVNGVSYLLLSEKDFWANRLVANLEVVILSLTIAWFVGSQIRKIVHLKEELQFALNHDPLTGASTRSHMNSFLLQDQILPCPVIITDIDHFKSVNDNFGHQAGDKVLSLFVALLAEQKRKNDLIIRLGGEEFLIILPFTKFNEAEIIAEKMRNVIAQDNFAINGKEIMVTASFGLGVIDSIDAVDDGILAADKALYRAKHSGRNRVCS
jgi:diguanylate cyclase (GGDEF)-like protein